MFSTPKTRRKSLHDVQPPTSSLTFSLPLATIIIVPPRKYFRAFYLSKRANKLSLSCLHLTGSYKNSGYTRYRWVLFIGRVKIICTKMSRPGCEFLVSLIYIYICDNIILNFHNILDCLLNNERDVSGKL